MSRDGLVEHCIELLSALGRARSRRMFGGHGLYIDDLFVALIAYDRLFLKSDDDTRSRFEAAGCQPFTFDKQGEPMVTSYWSAPEEAMDSPAAMAPWARLAVEAALRAQAKKALKSRKAPAPRAKQPPAAAPAASAAARPKASGRAKR
jgi:DNA transformation protein